MFVSEPNVQHWKPQTMTKRIAFLASDRSRYIHGANLRIDGGAADSVQ